MVNKKSTNYFGETYDGNFFPQTPYSKTWAALKFFIVMKYAFKSKHEFFLWKQLKCSYIKGWATAKNILNIYQALETVIVHLEAVRCRCNGDNTKRVMRGSTIENSNSTLTTREQTLHNATSTLALIQLKLVLMVVQLLLQESEKPAPTTKASIRIYQNKINTSNTNPMESKFAKSTVSSLFIAPVPC